MNLDAMVSAQARTPRTTGRFAVGVAAVLIAVGCLLPLTDVLRYPGRISVLPSLQVDAPTYDELGAAIAVRGLWTNVPPMQPPGFVVILGLVYRMFGHSLLAAKLMLWLSLLASTLLSGWLARRVWGTRAAWAAMTLTATAPALRHYVGTVQYEVVAATGLLVVLGLALKAAEATTRRAFAWALAAGIAGGALTLIREVFIGVVPIVGVWMATTARPTVGSRRAATLLVLFMAMFAAPVVWWSTLQSSRHGRTIVMTDKGSAALALGNNPRTSGTYNVDVIEQPAGLRFVVERPTDAMHLAIRKVMFFWGLRRDWWNVPRPAGLWLLRASGGAIPLELSLPMARGGWLLIAFLLSVVWLVRVKAMRQWWVLPACVVAGCAAHVVTLSSHRFAVPFLPVVFVLIAGPLPSIVETAWHWTASRRTRLSALVALVLLAVAAQWNGGPSEIAFRAAELDAMNVENVLDLETGRIVRYAPAAAGVRQAMVLADEYLPEGRFQMLITARRNGPALSSNTAVAHVTLTNLEGTAACSEDIPWGLLPEQGFGKIWVPCTLPHDGPATLVVQSLGVTDIYFDEVALIRSIPVH